MQLNPLIVRQQIENLKLSHPELLEDDEAWLMSLESETRIEDLLTQVIRQIEDTKGLVVGTKDRFEELKARKERFENRVEALRSLAFKLMEAAELPKLELPEATLSIRSVPPSVMVTDEEKLPDIACKFERKPDKAKIKELLASGWVAGATMTNGSKSLSIRIK
ncbi:siphovirus Gp157 family protein [Bradyrhizobium manausense]